MSATRNIAQGFFLMTNGIVVFITLLWLPSYVNLWIGLSISVAMSILFLLGLAIQVKNWIKKRLNGSIVEQVKTFLMVTQGISLACWFLDIVTTFIVIDIRITGSELNPLGWPNGIIGAAIYYIPVILGTYFLLYKVKSKWSFYGAVILTATTLVMASMNLAAGINNFANALQFFSQGTASSIIVGWSAVIFVLVITNVIVILKGRITALTKRKKQCGFLTALSS